MRKETMLTVDRLSVTIDKEEILKDISFSVSPGDVVALIGPNGAGKSVLLKSLLGLMPYQGKVTWASDAKIGYVPQRFHVAKTVPLTVREFFLLHEPSFLFAGKLFDRKIRRALAMVKVDPHNLTERLGNLSGGELQRVLIAWALYDRPNILLFDEPTAGIDVSGEETIYNLLHSLQDQLGITIILVSHELNVVYRYATFVLCLNKKLLCFGEPHTVLTAEQLKELYGQPTHYHHLHETAENVSAAGNSH